MKKMIALAVVFVLLLGLFAGCSGDTESGSQTETEIETETAEPVTIVGTWQYNMDFGKLLKAIQEDAATGESANSLPDLYDGLSVLLILDFREDGTFLATADEASVAEAGRELEEKLIYVLPELIAALNGMTPEEYEARLAEEGLTMDDMVAQYAEEVNAENRFDDMLNAAAGTYAYDGDLLYLTSEDGDTLVCTVELSAGELKFTDIEGETGDAPDGLLPLIFVRSGG